MKSTLFKPRNLVLGALALISAGLAAYPALATVTVTPMLALIEGRNRYADINLINTSGEAESYAVSWRFYKMKEDGIYDNSETSLTEFDLSKHLVVTPRRVTIEAGGMQKIRIGLRLKGEPPAPGDYRAHLMLMQDKGKAAGLIPSEEKGKISVGVHMNVGLSVPIIYRVGESDVTAAIGDVKTEINPKTNKIEVVVPITRTGGRYSILGSLQITYNGEVIGSIQNANIFDEIDQRIFKVALKEANLSGGALEIVYKDFDKNKNIIFAQKTVPVGR